MPPPRLRGGEQPGTDDDDDEENVKHARTTSGGGPFRDRRLDGGLGEAELPPVERRKRKLSAPPCKGERPRTDDDVATTGRLAGLPPRAGKRQRERRRKLPGPPSGNRRASSRELTMTMRKVALSRREQPVEEDSFAVRRLGGVLGEARPPLVEEPGFSPVTIASRWNLFHRPTVRRNLFLRPPSRARSWQRRNLHGRLPACWEARQAE